VATQRDLAQLRHRDHLEGRLRGVEGGSTLSLHPAIELSYAERSALGVMPVKSRDGYLVPSAPPQAVVRSLRDRGLVEYSEGLSAWVRTALGEATWSAR
jgi:hypothetical protein